MVQRVAVRLQGKRDAYRVEIGAGTLGHLGARVHDATVGESARRVCLVSNRTVFELYGEQASASLRAAGYRVETFSMPDGERYKSLHTAQRALAFLAEGKFERTDIVIALGGGVVGDLAGFVAALHLRGVRFVNVPTTLLAAIDASVGGKTGVNTLAGKNMIGAFHHPRLVLVDTDAFHTLEARDMTAGWCEAIKHGALSGAALFNATREFLLRQRQQQTPPATCHPRRNSTRVTDGTDNRAADALARLLKRQIAFKAKIVQGDELEDATRTDSRSRRILNFGHTVAHALEAATAYRRLRHGEAVGLGMIAATSISSRLGLLDEASTGALLSAISLVGKLPTLGDLDENLVLEKLLLDKKSVDGNIKWVLLKGIGKPVILDSAHIPPYIIRDSIRLALRQIPSSNSIPAL